MNSGNQISGFRCLNGFCRTACKIKFSDMCGEFGFFSATH